MELESHYNGWYLTESTKESKPSKPSPCPKQASSGKLFKLGAGAELFNVATKCYDKAGAGDKWLVNTDSTAGH